jgi:heat shock protein HslJ
MRLLGMPNALMVVALIAAACSSAPAPGDLPLAGDWELVTGNDGAEQVPMVPGYRITFTSDGTTFGGTAACNSYGGTISTDDNALALEEISVTEMACEPEVMASEQAYLTVLPGIDSSAREGDVLLLSGGGAELWFVAVELVPERELIGTVWNLETLLDGEAASSVSGDDPTLIFAADGTISGSTGCRRLAGTYIVIGDEIETPDLRADGECPAEFERQDGHVIGVLEGGFTVMIEGDRMTLTATGDQGLVYRAG